MINESKSLTNDTIRTKICRLYKISNELVHPFIIKTEVKCPLSRLGFYILVKGSKSSESISLYLGLRRGCPRLRLQVQQMRTLNVKREIQTEPKWDTHFNY